MNNIYSFNIPTFLQGLFTKKAVPTALDLSILTLENKAEKLNKEIVVTKNMDYRYLILRRKIAKIIISHPEQDLKKEFELGTSRRIVHAILLGIIFPVLCATIDVLVSSDAIGQLLNKLPWPSVVYKFDTTDSNNYSSPLENLLTYFTYAYAVIFVLLEISYGLFLSIANNITVKKWFNYPALIFYYLIKLLPVFVIPVLSFMVYDSQEDPASMLMFYSLAGLSVILHSTMVLFSKKIVDLWIFIILRSKYSTLKKALLKVERNLLDVQTTLLQQYNNFVDQVSQHYGKFQTIDSRPYLNLVSTEMREIANSYAKSSFEIPFPNNYVRRHNRNLMSNGIWHFADLHSLYNESAGLFNSPESPAPAVEEPVIVQRGHVRENGQQTSQDNAASSQPAASSQSNNPSVDDKNEPVEEQEVFNPYSNESII